MHIFLALICTIICTLANAQLSSCSVVCFIFNKYASDATIRTCYCVCYLKNLYLVTTDSSCLGLVTEARCWFGVRPVWRSLRLAFALFGVRPVWSSPCFADTTPPPADRRRSVRLFMAKLEGHNECIKSPSCLSEQPSFTSAFWVGHDCMYHGPSCRLTNHCS